jgi:hypothetical protein
MNDCNVGIKLTSFYYFTYFLMNYFDILRYNGTHNIMQMEYTSM